MEEIIETSFIWDLDGTLIDSYKVIVESVAVMIKEYGIRMTKEEIYRHVKKESVVGLFDELASGIEDSYEVLKAKYGCETKLREKDIELIDQAEEILSWLRDKGIKHYIYTHRGKTTQGIIERLGIDHYFIEVITSVNGFERKPGPEALDYLVNKYKLKKETTYYVGDRSLDVLCANNAGLQSVFFNTDKLDTADADFEIASLLEIKSMV